MKKAKLIVGFGAIGKTTLSKKYKNILDLESSAYKYMIDDNLKYLGVEERKGLKTRKINPKFPDNYYSAIIANLHRYDIILISMNNEIIKKLEENNIIYIVVYPKEDMIDEIIQRCIKRGNSNDFILGIKEAYYRLLPHNTENVLWLNKGEYLENVLIKNNILD